MYGMSGDDGDVVSHTRTVEWDHEKIHHLHLEVLRWIRHLVLICLCALYALTHSLRYNRNSSTSSITTVRHVVTGDEELWK